MELINVFEKTKLYWTESSCNWAFTISYNQMIMNISFIIKISTCFHRQQTTCSLLGKKWPPAILCFSHGIVEKIQLMLASCSNCLNVRHFFIFCKCWWNCQTKTCQLQCSVSTHCTGTFPWGLGDIWIHWNNTPREETRQTATTRIPNLRVDKWGDKERRNMRVMDT